MEIEKKVKQITLKEIVENYMEFCLNNDIFDKIEYSNVNEGEVLAYTQILDDIEVMSSDEFIEKYVMELKNLNEKLEDTQNFEEKEIEILSGFNNAIVNVIKLINPIYEYKIE